MTNEPAAQFAIELARIASESKSEDVIVLDLRGISPVAEYVVICTGTSDRQMNGVADQIIEYAKKFGEKPFGHCGQDCATWIIVDFVNVVFHIFARPHRAYYDLELLWGDAPRLTWQRSESA